MPQPPSTMPGQGTVWEQLARRLRRMAQQEARRVSPAVERYKVTHTGPLIVESLHRDFALEEGDPDFMIADTVDRSAPQIGEEVIVHRTTAGMHVAAHVVRRGNGQ